MIIKRQLVYSEQPDVCATLFDGQNQQGESLELPIGSFEHSNPRGVNEPIGDPQRPTYLMAMGDRAESVIVHPGCSLTVMEHAVRYYAGTGNVHTFTHDDGSTDMPENDNFSLVGLANNISSWECSCNDVPVEYPLACGEIEETELINAWYATPCHNE